MSEIIRSGQRVQFTTSKQVEPHLLVKHDGGEEVVLPAYFDLKDQTWKARAKKSMRVESVRLIYE